jgi:hypothetical protein
VEKVVMVKKDMDPRDLPRRQRRKSIQGRKSRTEFNRAVVEASRLAMDFTGNPSDYIVIMPVTDADRLGIEYEVEDGQQEKDRPGSAD